MTHFRANNFSERRSFDGRGGRTIPATQVMLGLLALVIVMVLGARQIKRAGTTAVWTASAAMGPGAVLDSRQAKAVRLPSKKLPEGAISADTDMDGRVLHRPKNAGDVFLASDFIQPQAPRAKTYLSDTVPEGRVLLTVKVSSTSIPYPQLRHGDRLDLIAGGRGHGPGPHSSVVAHDAFLIGSIAPSGGPKPAAKKNRLGMDTSPPKRQKKGGNSGLHLILALHPQDVLGVSDALGRDAPMTVMLHGRHEIQAGRLLSAAGSEDAGVELISGAKRETITFPAS